MNTKQKKNRRSIRLKEYDYSNPWWYYITLCTHQHQHKFGKVRDCKMLLNHLGEIANKNWSAIPEHFPNTELDDYIIMPNHIHGIIIINKKVIDEGIVESKGVACCAPTDANRMKHGSLGVIIRSFKSSVTKEINDCWENRADFCVGLVDHCGLSFCRFSMELN